MHFDCFVVLTDAVAAIALVICGRRAMGCYCRCRCQALFDKYIRWLAIISWVLLILSTLAACLPKWAITNDRSPPLSVNFQFQSGFVLHITFVTIRKITRVDEKNDDSRWSCNKFDRNKHAFRLKCRWSRSRWRQQSDATRRLSFARSLSLFLSPGLWATTATHEKFNVRTFGIY